MNLESTYQKHLTDLNELASIIGSNSEMNDLDLNACDVDTLRHLIKQNKVSVQAKLKTFNIYSCCRMIIFHCFFQDTESILQQEARLKLEDVTFDVQCFISENTQFLSPSQSSYLLKLLSTTQRAFRDQTEIMATQRSTLDVLLDTRERENQEKVCLWIKYYRFFLND